MPVGINSDSARGCTWIGLSASPITAESSSTFNSSQDRIITAERVPCDFRHGNIWINDTIAMFISFKKKE